MADLKKNRRVKEGLQSSSSVPPQIVCTAKAAAGKNTIELGAILSLAVVALYMFACIESGINLPELSTRRNLSGNLNIAKLQRTAYDSRRSTIARATPPATWPVKFKDEVGNVETIVHPGDFVTKMVVPKFWSPPLHEMHQYTRKQAMEVGTCAEPDPQTGSHVRGDDCPTDQRTVFIAIASYRDFQCRKTVESAFSRAKVR